MIVFQRLRILLPLLALVALLAVAGCGGETASAPKLTSFASAAERSAAAETARFSLAFEVTIPGSETGLNVSAEGGFDTPAKRARLTIDLSSLAALFKSIGSAFGGDVEGELGSPEDWKLEAIQDGETAYIRFPLLADKLPPGKTWVKGDAKELSSVDADELQQFGSFAGTDPRDLFGILKAVSGSIEALGREELRGVETNHYRATVDVAKLADLVPAGKAESLGGLGSLDQAAKQAGLSTVPVEIWIGADEQVRKLVVDVDTKGSGASSSLKASLVLELYDYGVALDLELPPAEQVVSASELKQAP